MDIELLNTLNDKHKNKLFSRYNPVTGEGSLEDRFEFRLTDKVSVFLPAPMKNLKAVRMILRSKGKTVDKYTSRKIGADRIDLWRKEYIQDLMYVRQKYDFEYWAYTCYHIIAKDGTETTLCLNAPQRKTLHILEEQRLSNKPIRGIICKARQWGGSTLTDAYIMWVQTKWKQNWNGVIATLYKQQAYNIRDMYERAITYYPKKEFTLSNASLAGDVKIINETGCKTYIGSLQNQEVLRSGNYAMAHCSEVGLWQEKAHINPRNFISSVTASILSKPLTIIVLESTAKGEGNYFHEEWLKAVNGTTNFAPIFVGWWEIEMYQLDFENDEDKLKFFASLTDYEQWLWNLGATLEGIHWYRNYKQDHSYTEWQMHEEFPSSWEEAFVSSGQRVFDIPYVNNLQEDICEPAFIGEVAGDSNEGENALKNIRFQQGDNGRLKIWKFPDTSIKVSNRYLVSMDIGGRSSVADYSVIRVIDRYWRIKNGVDEFVATWRGHLDVDLAVWKAAQIAKMYDNALLVVERNTIDSKHQHTDGVHTYTVFNEIVGYYDNIYASKDPQKIIQGVPPKYGFFTGSGGSATSKGAIIDNLTKLLRTKGFVEHDMEMLNELNLYEYKSDGTMGAKDGYHDDVLMASGIGLLVSNTPKDIDDPREYDESTPVSYIN